MKGAFPIVLCVVLLGCAAEREDGRLETADQKISYALGYNMGKNAERDLTTQAVAVDQDLVLVGLRDALAGNEARLTATEMRRLIAEFQRRLRLEQEETVRRRTERHNAEADKNRHDGQAFLARNKAKEGVKATESGLQYRVMRPGTGKSPTTKGTVIVHYRGRLIDGTVFDSSHEHGEPAAFRVDRVIDGWTEALLMMGEGAKWEIAVPSELGYGRSGRKPDIGPDAVLVFEIELIEAN